MSLAVNRETQEVQNVWSVGMEKSLFPNLHILKQQAVMLSACNSQHPKNRHPNLS